MWAASAMSGLLSPQMAHRKWMQKTNKIDILYVISLQCQAKSSITEAMNLNRLAYFAAVVDTGSFTRAAERLGITKAVVSQQVAHLERELQTTLPGRSTRRVPPTEAGRMF